MLNVLKWRWRVLNVTVLVLAVIGCSSDPEVITLADPTTTTSADAGSDATLSTSGAEATTTTPDSTTTTSMAATTTTTQADDSGLGLAGNPVAPGVTVRVKGFEDVLEVTLIEVLDPATPVEFFGPAEGNRLVGLRFAIANAGDNVWSDSPSNSVTVITEDNVQYGPSFSFIADGPDFFGATTAPGDIRQGWVSIELPDDAMLARIRYTPDSGFADETAEWDLSLPPVVSEVDLVTIPQASVGDAITLEGFSGEEVQVKVEAVVDPAQAGSFFGPATGNRYVAIQLTLTNVGTNNYMDSVDNIPTVVTPEGFSYTTTITEVTAGPGFQGSVLLTPGDVRTGWVTFEIPDGVTLAKLTATLDSGFGPQTGEWAIG